MSLCLSRGHDLDEFKRIASAPSMDLLGSVHGSLGPLRPKDHIGPQGTTATKATSEILAPAMFFVLLGDPELGSPWHTAKCGEPAE